MLITPARRPKTSPPQRSGPGSPPLGIRRHTASSSRSRSRQTARWTSRRGAGLRTSLDSFDLASILEEIAKQLMRAAFWRFRREDARGQDREGPRVEFNWANALASELLMA